MGSTENSKQRAIGFKVVLSQKTVWQQRAEGAPACPRYRGGQRVVESLTKASPRGRLILRPPRQAQAGHEPGEGAGRSPLLRPVPP